MLLEAHVEHRLPGALGVLLVPRVQYFDPEAPHFPTYAFQNSLGTCYSGRGSIHAPIGYLCVVSGRNPTQPKKSLRKLFSGMPTSPVAGEALNLHLSQQQHMGSMLTDPWSQLYVHSLHLFSPARYRHGVPLTSAVHQISQTLREQERRPICNYLEEREGLRAPTGRGCPSDKAYCRKG